MSDPQLEFFTLPAAWGNLSVSPFCGKLHTWLVLAKLDFKLRTANLQKAPNGKVPYVRLPGGETLGDSSRIIATLTASHGVTLDDHLSATQRAVGHLVQRTCEESLYWACVYQRWYTDAGFVHTREMLSGLAPKLLLPIISRVARKKAVVQVLKQGTGLHPEAHVCALAAADLAALATTLGDGPFLFGERQSSFDAILYAFTSAALRMAHPNGVRDAAASHPNLVTYIERLDALVGHQP